MKIVFALVLFTFAFTFACGGDKPPMVPDSENATPLDAGAE